MQKRADYQMSLSYLHPRVSLSVALHWESIAGLLLMLSPNTKNSSLTVCLSRPDDTSAVLSIYYDLKNIIILVNGGCYFRVTTMYTLICPSC